ncbi:hypothetical protein [Massilia violaceinigra]|uniref:hypothetical protein n=1 Tax=Massilia violaceinigra TaxID=2045208 RepID=UPI001E594E74|nr:hypothetical protein [Massilia violaceinigra]
MKQHGFHRGPTGIRLSILAMPIASLHVTGWAQSAGAGAEVAPPAVVVTGTRVSNRSVLDTASPADVVTSELINNMAPPK